MVVCARHVRFILFKTKIFIKFTIFNRGLDDQSEILLPAGIKESVIKLLDDGNNRIRLAAASCVLTIPIPEKFEKMRQNLLHTIDNDQEVTIKNFSNQK